jgi:class 3 adenylate cyclase
MPCPRCQRENRPQAKFCEECGAPLARSCGHCGAALSSSAKFCSECGRAAGVPPEPETRFASPDAYTPKNLAEKILTSKSALEGERKLVTVLFADLKGSMELLADRDPEEARKLLDPVLERMMDAVHRYEGTVNQVMGDGIMALFGAPLAHEDHAVRACYAALDIQTAIHRYGDEVRRTHGIEPQIRVGLNSGEVVVRAIGNDLRMDYTAVGQTTHLAARMEQLAPAGTIRLTANTLRLAEGYITVKPLGPVPVKGLETPIDVYEMTAAGTLRSRLHAAAARGLTRLVGREPDVEQLRQALGRAAAGAGQVVALVGEPGVGIVDASRNGSLPPRPRQALPPHGRPGEGPRAPDDRERHVPRDGHGVLAGEGGVGVGLSGTMTRVSMVCLPGLGPPRRALRGAMSFQSRIRDR